MGGGQVLRKIERLRNGLHGNIKRLHEAEAAYRPRMGDFRILFDVEGHPIVIRRIGNRKDIYDQGRSTNFCAFNFPQA